MSGPVLHVEPEVSGISWTEFHQTKPAGSIALDGYVIGPPTSIYKNGGWYANLDHHRGVDRLATWSTAMQVVMKANAGLVKAFSTDGVFAPHVYVNDCDQDVALAWWLLEHIGEVRHGSNPMIRKLTHVAGIIDATSAAFPWDPNERILRNLAWVFEPYSSFRAAGGLARPDARTYRQVIENVGARITAYLHGRGEEMDLDFRYQVVGGGQGWQMIEEIGTEGRRAAFNDGMEAFVIAQALPNGRWWYTIGRVSEFLDFPVPQLRRELNKMEPEGTPPWGGNAIIGGGPRPSGSTLSPQIVQDAICTFLARRNSKANERGSIGRIEPLQRWVQPER